MSDVLALVDAEVTCRQSRPDHRDLSEKPNMHTETNFQRISECGWYVTLLPWESGGAVDVINADSRGLRKIIPIRGRMSPRTTSWKDVPEIRAMRAR